ncbi:uncharacterized protein LOC124919906 [Impatiens glandulifera]|uniref:uncharacterized protein LOC124919906 n=1 Tax=Impatiens glandulifera TaxID=253017 RepID=UPI001FB07FD3|nr:uncharacterized protein LOC124919906 [Impatiens glandulifera]
MGDVQIRLNHRLSTFLITKTTVYISFVLFFILIVIGYLYSFPGESIGDNYRFGESSDHYRFDTFCSEPEPAHLIRTKLIDAFFNGTSPYANFPPKHAIPLLTPAKINGWDSNNVVFSNLMRKYRPKTIIEVGTFLGMSAIHMAELSHEIGLDSQIICVDNFRAWPGLDIPMINGDVLLMYQFMQNLVHKNVTESVLFLPYSTTAALDKMCKMGIYGDMIEIDAAHDFHSAWSDLNRAYKVLARHGVIFGHDYFNKEDHYGVRRAVNLFARFKGLRVETDGMHWVIHPSKSIN